QEDIEDIVARSCVPWGGDVLDVLLEVDVRSYLPDDLLVKVDVASMAHSLEVRSPLLDHEVMEFAASLPPRYKARGTRRKRIVRRAYQGVVPDSTLNGPKRGFGVPLVDWFRGDLERYAREVLLDPVTTQRGYTRPDAVRAILDA